MKRSDITVEVYEIGSWVIYIEEDNKNYSAYLRHNAYGVTDFMFGGPKYQSTKEEFLEIVEANLGKYINYYYEDYLEADGFFDEDGERR